jgi:nickel/cobalt transporter (NiCoT) family protein
MQRQELKRLSDSAVTATEMDDIPMEGNLLGIGGMASQDWMGLVLIVFVLGLKHGMDPDHLATIDGLTRFNAHARPLLARWSGCLFSLGHALVAGVVALMTTRWSAPLWIEHAGVWISIVFLLALGGANLAAVFRTPRNQLVQPLGLKARWLGRLTQTSHPVIITSIGAAFALSFDTWSQAALFSMTATHLSGWGFAVVLGLVFTLGMMIADGLNGIWVARLLRRADRRALIASRVMSLMIALLSLSVAALGLGRYFLPEVAAATEDAGMLLGLGVITLIFASFAVAIRLSGRSGVAQ